MRSFTLHQPSTLTEAIEILESNGTLAKPVGGGSDLVAGLMRDSICGDGMPYPEHLVDLGTVNGLTGIDVSSGQVRIGAMTVLADLFESELLQLRLPLLAEAAGRVASPEIRSVGTLGGNLNQRPRCWFFRMKDFDCIKKGGDICFAVKGDSRYNAIVDGHLCFIVNVSDLAIALVALGASATIVGPGGRRIVAFDDYFVLPLQDLLRETVLEPDEILIEVHVPIPSPDVGQAWVKVNEKGKPTWDFAVISAAVAARTRDGVWEDGRIVVGGIAPTPYRATVVEEALSGRHIADSVREAASQIRRVARPMRDNAYKVDLAETVIERAVRMAASTPDDTWEHDR